jgi:hypothetical protein
MAGMLLVIVTSKPSIKLSNANKKAPSLRGGFLVQLI